ncbi:hypothetical protein [Alicyclobacillus acidiphilus]|uniref:hypothetical protein n=1 Tax=Alicyclobacillus acidiphilus TaxID=182455 RepID=UPI00082F99CB|nr:hypothetical protein [Alicyclobacillus acidiphilus]
MPFDVYAFADYSGSSSPAGQRQHIVFAMKQRDGGLTVVRRLTRAELWIETCNMLIHAEQEGRRAILGFDHSYSFPRGLFDHVAHRPWTSWRELLNCLAQPTPAAPHPLGDPLTKRQIEQLRTRCAAHPAAAHALDDVLRRMDNTVHPRTWAASVNHWFRAVGITLEGPFWGTNWSIQERTPDFPFSVEMPEKRLVERLCQVKRGKSMKPIYQLGGQGSVGQQSLFGIPYVHALLEFCDRLGIPLFCWPYDGWDPPSYAHVLVEVYPTLYNHGPRTDEGDAVACVEWMEKQDHSGGIPFAPDPGLSEDECRLARLEGWVIGV